MNDHDREWRKKLMAAGWIKPDHDGGFGARRWLSSRLESPWDETHARLDSHVVPLRDWPPPPDWHGGTVLENMAWRLAMARWQYATSDGRTGKLPANRAVMTGWGRPELESALQCGGPLDAPVE